MPVLHDYDLYLLALIMDDIGRYSVEEPAVVHQSL